MLAIQSLCTRALLLENGRVATEGATEQTVMRYLASVEQLHSQPLTLRDDRVGGERFRFSSVQFLDSQTMAPCDVLISGQATIIRIGFLCESDIIDDVGIDLSFRTLSGVHVFGCSSRAIGRTFTLHAGEGYTDCVIPRWPLKTGCYSCNLFAEKGGSATLDWIVDAAAVNVENGDYYGSGRLPVPNLPGVLVDYSWQGS
jgi:lipopolysaccharide transport system ATP-binding protein